MTHPYSHPHVTNATLADGKIALRVDVTDVHTTTGAIEITGEATQVSGAFAPISFITDIAAATRGDPADSEESGRYFVDVEAIPTPDRPFSPDGDVSVFVRVSKASFTVLGPGTAEQGGVNAVAGATWDQVRWSTDPWGGPLTTTEDE